MNPPTNKMLHGANGLILAAIVWCNGELSEIKKDVAAVKANPCRCAVSHQASSFHTNHFAVLNK